MSINIKNLSKRFNRVVLQGVSFVVPSGACCALVGESGSGKSTLLRLVAGLEKADGGEIWVNERLLTGNKVFVPPQQRNVGLMFQQHTLFPNMTVTENINFATNHKSHKHIEWLQIGRLTDHADQYPHQLSGGQQQRVALLRTLAAAPSVVLLDEPFSRLDESLKTQLRQETKRLLALQKTTVIVVTHDSRDAFALADYVAVLQNGVLQQFGEINQVFEQPNNEYVANFFGKINCLEYYVYRGENRKKIGIRPQEIVLTDEHRADWQGVVEEVVSHGFYKEVRAKNKETELFFYVSTTENIQINTTAYVCFKTVLWA